MKRIINGKKYDTETAQKIKSREFNPWDADGWFTETLYQKKNTEFFLCGRGNNCSKYKQFDSEIGGIIPLSWEDSHEWVEDHANSQYETIFGECEE